MQFVGVSRTLRREDAPGGGPSCTTFMSCTLRMPGVPRARVSVILCCALCLKPKRGPGGPSEPHRSATGSITGPRGVRDNCPCEGPPANASTLASPARLAGRVARPQVAKHRAPHRCVSTHAWYPAACRGGAALTAQECTHPPATQPVTHVGPCGPQGGGARPPGTELVRRLAHAARSGPPSAGGVV